MKQTPNVSDQESPPPPPPDSPPPPPAPDSPPPVPDLPDLAGDAGDAGDAGAPDPRAQAVPAGPRRFRCRQCAADLVFRPGTSQLSCSYCGFVNEIDADAASGVEELDYRAHLAMLAEAEPTLDVRMVKCSACGSETEAPENLDAFRCAFCGTSMVSGSISERLLKPRSLLPFAITGDEAHRTFRQWIAKRWFAPNDLKRFSHSDGRMRGVYLPYWTYDAKTVSDYTGARGDDYYVTESYTVRVNGKTQHRTRQVRKTRWSPAAGTVRNVFDDVLVPASRSLPVKDVEHLEPWDLDQLVPYKDDYLAGFTAEKYHVDLPSGFQIAGEKMEPAIHASICRDIGGDHQRVQSVDTRYHDVTFKHMLLPVWVSAYRFRDRLFRIIINARTGELRGQRPYSAWKIAFAVLGGLAAVAVIALVAGVFR